MFVCFIIFVTCIIIILCLLLITLFLLFVYLSHGEKNIKFYILSFERDVPLNICFCQHRQAQLEGMNEYNSWMKNVIY